MPAPEKLHTRRATLALNSFNSETRTFQAIAATDAPVLRNDLFDGQFYERLLMTPGAMRQARLQSGRMPILDNHRAASAGAQLGVVTRSTIREGQLVVDGRLTQADVATPIAQSAADGVACNVSLGYRVFKSERSKGPEGLPLVTITDWEPIELSFVPVGADPNAYIRNLKGKTMPQARKQNRVRPDQQRAPAAGDVLDRTVDDEIDELETETRGADDLSADDLADDAGDRSPVARRVMSDRHARQAYDIAARHSLDAEWARRAIAGGVTLREFRAEALDEAGKRADRTRINPRSRIGFDDDPSGSLGNAIGGALYSRMTGKPPEGPAVEWRGRSLLEMGAALLEARGERVSWRNRSALAGQIFARAGGQHTTSDFPILLQQSSNRVLLDSYKAAQSPLLLLAKRRDAVDFRPMTAVKLSEAPKLEKVLEGAELKYGTRAEAKESFRIFPFGKIFTLSREAIINDDLGAFADTSTAWGRAAAETEASELTALLAANSGDGANLDDNSPLYATTRGNKAASGGAISVGTLGVARKAMREFKGLDGKTPISVTPKHLVVGAAKETEAEQVLATLAATQVAEQNPFGGKLTLHVESRLTGNAWRLFADPSELAVIQIAYLNGQDGPVIETHPGWETLGTEFRVVMDFGCGLVEWRGTYLNSGN